MIGKVLRYLKVLLSFLFSKSLTEKYIIEGVIVIEVMPLS